jgi:hypothetical protein
VATLAAAALEGCPSEAGQSGPPAKRSLVPVAIRLPATSSTDVAATAKVPLSLKGKRVGWVRVTATFRAASGAVVKLGERRVLRLAPNRWLETSVPVVRAARPALQACPGGTITLTVSNSRLGRPRTAQRAFRVAPPACGRFFGSAAIWNAPNAASAPLDPDSTGVTQDLMKKIDAGNRNGLPPTIATYAYAPPVYTVPASQPHVRVVLDRGQDASLANALGSVPLPASARPAPGSDKELVLWQPGSNALWEFWHLRRSNGEWHATWGGRLDDVTRSPGYFTAPHANWGTTASSLALVGGMMTPRELATGRIDHALSVAVPSTRASAFSRPAQRTDGTSPCLHAVPEGAHFRLDPSLDVASLNLPAPIAAMARAAQTYGIYVRDQSDSVTFYAQSSVSLSSDPYPAIFGGQPPYDLLRSFPWSHLQLTKMDLVQTGRGDPVGAVLQGCG